MCSWLWTLSHLWLCDGLSLHLECLYIHCNLSHRFATHAHRFIDAYAKGLQGKGAAWAAKKYRGH